MGYIVNAFQIPNELVDRLLVELSPNALKCYLIIVRKTIGWGKEYDSIAIDQFMKLSGIRKDDTIRAAIRELLSLKLIESVEVAGRPKKYKVVTQTPPENRDPLKSGDPQRKGRGPLPKKGDPLNRDPQNSSSSKPNKPTLSSSLPPQPIEEEEGGVSVKLVPLDPYSEIPEEGMDDLSKEQIVTGIEGIIEVNAGDADTYRASLVREILAGGGRTLSNIRRRLAPHPSRARTGSNRAPTLLPPGLSVFELYEALPSQGPGGVL